LRELPLGTLEILKLGVSDVTVHCRSCLRTKTVLLNNLKRGMTRDCGCQSRFLVPGHPNQDVIKSLIGRYVEIKQRCTNPKCRSYGNYGGRGIENRFTSSKEFVHHVLTHLPHPTYKGVDIGRINNSGHYEPGNIQLESRSDNLRNRRSNHWIDYKGAQVTITDLYAHLKRDNPEFSLNSSTTRRLASQNVPWQEILKRKPRPSRAHPNKPRMSTTS
jgi:hypothetical protein